MLDHQISRADDAFARMSRGKLIASTLMVLPGLLAVVLGADSMIDRLLYILFYAPFCLIYIQMLLTRRRERTWGPLRAKQNAALIVDWLAANTAYFEEQGVSEEVLTGAVGLRRIEAADAALDLLENQEVVVRQPDKTLDRAILVKPGRHWHQTRATLALQASPDAPPLGARPTEALDDISTKTTQPLPR